MNNESFEEIFEDDNVSAYTLMILMLIFMQNKDFSYSLQAQNKVEEAKRFEPFNEE